MKTTLVLAAVLAAAAVGAEPAAPELRLPDTVQPLRQAVELTVDPAAESFTGTVDIDMEVRKVAPVVWLNARGLEIREASFGFADGRRPARVVEGTEDFVGFAGEEAFGTGPLSLHVSFAGAVSRVEHQGVFAVREAEDWYLYTNFEPLAARQAFPCFDEPGYKIPWEVTLRVPPGLVALSNAPAAETREEDDRAVVAFRATRPLPSYLVAFAVGPFDLVDLGPLGRRGTPARLAVPKGRGGDTAWARETTGPILSLLEGYFDQAYPYAKLDQVAIPGAGYAMEHPGLVTYGQELMVQREEEQTTSNRRGWVITCAHELAHMWFGNLVTLQWWDDTWLNEAFASWMEQRITAELRPDWDMDLSRVDDRTYALRADSLSSARRIRQPIESRHDIENAFDGITYYKGKAVLEMVESWLGEGVFQRGVRSYMRRHAWGNAKAGDFFEALSRAAGKDVSPVFSTFLEQVGAPVITARRTCGAEPRLVLGQKPYHALGSGGSQGRTWQVPICAAYARGDARATGCTLLTGESGELALGAGGDCPGWALANAGARGYYRLAVTGEEARGLLEGGRLTVAERLGLAGDVGALVGSGDISARDALELVSMLARDPHPRVLEAAVDLLDGLEPLVPDAQMEGYETLVRRVFGARARELGWSGRDLEDEAWRLVRPRVVGFVGTDGGDEALGQQAAALTRQWLRDPGGVDPDMVGSILAVAARHADTALYESLESVALGEPDRHRRTLVLAALGAVRDPVLARRATGLVFDERVDSRETFRLASGLSRDRPTRRLLWELLEEHWDAVAARLSPDTVAYLPHLARGECDIVRRSELEAFLGPRVEKVDGGPRQLEQVLERIDQCVAQRAAQQASVVALLGGR